MSSKTYRGVVRGQAVVFGDGSAPLPDGTEVLVIPLSAEPGTPAAVLAAMKAEPQLTAEDVAELERAIAEGRRPLAHLNPFAEASGETEAP